MHCRRINLTFKRLNRQYAPVFTVQRVYTPRQLQVCFGVYDAR